MDGMSLRYGFMHGLASVTYVAAVVLFLSNSELLFSDAPEIFAGLLMLTLLVVSAAVMAMLVFGRPVLWYLDGKKKEAVYLALYTVGFIVLIAAVILACIFFAV